MKKNSDKEFIVNALLSIFEQIGKEKFTIYEDGDVEYNYIDGRGDEFNVR